MSVPEDPTIHLTARIPRSAKDDLDALARATGRNRNELVQEALRRFIDVQRWQIARIEEGLRAADAGDFATDTEIDELWAEFGLEPESSRERAS